MIITPHLVKSGFYKLTASFVFFLARRTSQPKFCGNKNQSTKLTVRILCLIALMPRKDPFGGFAHRLLAQICASTLNTKHSLAFLLNTSSTLCFFFLRLFSKQKHDWVLRTCKAIHARLRFKLHNEKKKRQGDHKETSVKVLLMWTAD